VNAMDQAGRNSAAVAAALLGQGARVDALSRLLTVGALAGLAWAGTAGDHGLSASLCGSAALAGLAQLYVAVRVGFDATLFGLLARESGPDLAALDRAMRDCGLVAPSEVTRPLGPRVAGARRLMAGQAALTAAQAVLLTAAGAAA
jgi:hypothetical protein